LFIKKIIIEKMTADSFLP